MSDARSATRLSTQADIEHAAAFRAELRRFLARTETATREAGLTTQRYDLLLAVEAAGGELTITELCSRLGMRQTAVTELVKRARAAGLVTRKGSTIDRRVVLVSVTPEARRRLGRASDALRADRAVLAEALGLAKSSFEAPQAPELHPILEPPAPTGLAE